MPCLFDGTVATAPGVLTFRVYVNYIGNTVKSYTVKFKGGSPAIDEKMRYLSKDSEPTVVTVQTFARDTFGEPVAQRPSRRRSAPAGTTVPAARAGPRRRASSPPPPPPRPNPTLPSPVAAERFGGGGEPSFRSTYDSGRLVGGSDDDDESREDSGDDHEAPRKKKRQSFDALANKGRKRPIEDDGDSSDAGFRSTPGGCNSEADIITAETDLFHGGAKQFVEGWPAWKQACSSDEPQSVTVPVEFLDEVVGLLSSVGDATPGRGLVTALSEVLNSSALKASLGGTAKGRIDAGLTLYAELKAALRRKGDDSDDAEESDDDEGEPSEPSQSVKAHISRDVNSLIRCMFVLGSGDEARTRLLFERFVQDPTILEALRPAGGTDAHIIDNIAEIVASPWFQSKGSRRGDAQQLLDYVAACCASEQTAAKHLLRAVAERLGLSREAVRRGADEHGRILNEGPAARARKPRYDRRDATFVRDLSHSEEISRLDTNARRRKRVKTSDGYEWHEPHVLQCTRGEAAEQILRSDAYAKWQQLHKRTDGRPLAMSKSFVQQNLCPCLSDATFRECADPIKTGMLAWRLQRRRFLGRLGRERESAPRSSPGGPHAPHCPPSKPPH